MTEGPTPGALIDQMLRNRRSVEARTARHFRFLQKMVASRGLGSRGAQEAAMLVALERYTRKRGGRAS